MTPFLEKLTTYADRTAFVAKDGESSYEALVAATQAAQKQLSEAGATQGSVVAICGEYSLNAIACLLAVYEIGGVAVPIAPGVGEQLKIRLQEAAVQLICNCEGPQIQITSRSADAQAHAYYNALKSKNHAGLVLFSSGSTGKPKAMLHDLNNLLDSYMKKRGRKMALMLFLMFDHIGGLNTLFNALSMGAQLVIPSTRNPEEVAELLARYQVQILPTSPTFLNLLLLSEAYKKHDVSSLLMITYGTEAMPEGLLRRLKAAFPHTKFVQTFGTSETGITKTSSKSSESTLMKIDDPDVEYKIVDGELWLRSQTQILGYLNADNSKFTEDGWFRTGDIAEQLEDGYLRIKGRNNDVINVGGEKVLPGEVESVLMEMPEVKDCLVFRKESAITGQTVAAKIVPEGEIELSALRKAVRKYCRTRLEPYKVPTDVTLVDTLGHTNRFKKVRSA